MRRIAHVSDLHFGRFDLEVSEGLFVTLTELNIDFLIVSGDLTQRARAEEFQAAKNYLERLNAAGIKTLVIPGNHDIAPFYKPIARMFRPFKEYQKHISDRMELYYCDEEVAVTSINTVRATHIENGSMKRKQVEEARLWLSSLPKHIVKMVVTHHPLYRNPIKKMRTPAWRIGRAMDKLHEAGVDIYISGHLHRTSFRRTDALVVQAGTVSERLRGEEPSFNLLVVNCPHLKVETYRWNIKEKMFKPGRLSALLIKNKPLLKQLTEAKTLPSKPTTEPKRRTRRAKSKNTSLSTEMSQIQDAVLPDVKAVPTSSEKH